MKKRGIIIIAMLLFSAVLFYLASGLQKSTVNSLSDTDKKGSTEVNASLGPKMAETDKQKEASADASSADITSKEAAGSSDNKPAVSGQNQTVSEANRSNQNKPIPAPAPKPVSKVFTIRIIDTTSNNRVILKKQINCDGKSSLYDYTRSALDAAGIKKYIKSSGYIAMIDNLFDYPSMPDKSGKDDWTSAGWIYYVNGNKSAIGSKNYTPKANDIIDWKYWKDAIYEK